MKKTLLFLALSVSTIAGAQNITNETFDAYFPGDVGTDITGATASNGMYTIATNLTLSQSPTSTATNAGNDNFQIVENDLAHINVLQITGTNGNWGSRNLWFDGFADAWAERTAGNDIVEVEFEIYTGTPGASKNRMGIYIYNADRTKILGGFSMDTSTLVLSGVAYYLAPTPPAANYLFYLGGGTNNITLPANTWVRLGVSFNKTTGQVIWKGANPIFNGQVVGAAIGTDPDRTSIISTSGSTNTAPVVTNTAAATILFDNINVRATNVDTLLGVEQVLITDESFAVFPNPATNVVNITNDNTKIKQVTMTDLNGRVVKQASFDNLSKVELNIAELATGVYMMNIQSEAGDVTKKIIKQ